MRSISRQSGKRSKIGAQQHVIRQHEQQFRRGSLMFIEGETGTEMFIIRSGKARILKQEGDGTVELAVLGPGSVLGELSLLDHQQRSATAQVIEDVTATVVDESLFEATMNSVPPWLANIVQLVVKRLRDTMKKTDDNIVQRSVGGVLKILLLLYDTESVKVKGENAVSLIRTKDVVNATIGIGDTETENALLHLILKELILIRKNDAGREFILFRNLAAARMYVTYLRAHQRGAVVRGENLQERDLVLLDTVLAAGRKSGRRVKDKIILVGLQQIASEQERRGGGHHLDQDALDSLEAARMLVPQESSVQTTHQSHTQTAYLYN
ncbi:MAG: cyclic nucleotide-binding domain-containing protein, partial [Chitinivibrionales bacterium]|nr:cyclic nucleotide-binding domain-containing protein [Chitinivibrionales bacterium]MBD3356954.1 cyclic nucleotide-binding domain-containing protein [Chitinivibrionales bacterium]